MKAAVIQKSVRMRGSDCHLGQVLAQWGRQ
jgi:hypothetical protein